MSMLPVVPHILFRPSLCFDPTCLGTPGVLLDRVLVVFRWFTNQKVLFPLFVYNTETFLVLPSSYLFRDLHSVSSISTWSASDEIQVSTRLPLNLVPSPSSVRLSSLLDLSKKS